MSSGERVLYLCIFRKMWRGVCAERQKLALSVHFQANLEGSLCGKTKTGGTARELEQEGLKRQNIVELVGCSDSGGEMERKVEFKTVQGSAPTISVW